MGLKKYILARLAWAFVVSFLIVSVSFILLATTPNPQVDEAATQAALEGGNPQEARERAKKLRGLDRPIHERYVDYVTNIYTLNWGWSESRAEPVTDAVASGLYYTAQYSVPWTILTLILGPLVGVYSAANQYSWRDHIATFFAFFGYAIPNFFFGIVLLLIFGIWLGWIPVTYDPGNPVFSVDNAIGLSMPVLTLVTGSVGGLMRVSRNESAEYINSDFMKTAKAKGVSPLRAYALHVFRPTMVPLSTTVVAQMLALFTGASVLVEEVFSIPGLGRLLFNAATKQDTALFLITTMVFVFVAVVGNLISDLVYTVLDPRIDYGERTS